MRAYNKLQIDLLIILFNLVARVQLLKSFTEIFFDTWQEIPFGSRACLHVIRILIPQLREGHVAHEVFPLLHCVVNMVAQLSFASSCGPNSSVSFNNLFGLNLGSQAGTSLILPKIPLLFALQNMGDRLCKLFSQRGRFADEIVNFLFVCGKPLDLII